MAWREKLHNGTVIPAHPLALTADRKLDERRQRALTRYYIDAGAGGLAVGVHTTQFQIHDPDVGLLQPVLELAVEEMHDPDFIRIAGICGRTRQAVREAELALSLGYHAGLVSLGALREDSIDVLIDHIKAVAAVIPVIGFYLQPAVGGRVLPYKFWSRLTQIDNLLAIKVAPFNRYQTVEVLRAVADSGRASEIALYTGNDDNIIADLLTSFQGGLLGQWAVWTKNAVELFKDAKSAIAGQQADDAGAFRRLLRTGVELTDANAAIFDAANGFHGCVPGIHEILRRQGLLTGTWCLDPHEELSPGQSEEIDRILRLYPHLTDSGFVHENLDRWLR